MLYSLRPKFSALATLVALLPVQLFFTIWCGGFFGFPLSAYLQQEPALVGRTGFPLFPAVIWCAGAAFFIVPLIGYIRKKRNYAATEYLVFRDHVEFEDGFFMRRKKAIRFEDVLEVDFRQNPLQRRAGIASIQLATQQDPWGLTLTVNGKRQQSGLLLRDIANPEIEYDRLRDLIAKSRQAAPPPAERRASGSVPTSTRV